jgi:acyl carrier protein
MKDQIFKEIVEIVSKVLRINKKKINIKSRSSNEKNWDSLANFNILLALEKKYKLRIKTKDYEKLNNLKDIVKLIERSIR